MDMAEVRAYLEANTDEVLNTLEDALTLYMGQFPKEDTAVAERMLAIVQYAQHMEDHS